MFNLKSFAAGLGLAAVTAVAPFGASAATLGAAVLEVTGFVEGTYEQDTGAVDGSGFVTIEYDFNLPFAEIPYSGTLSAGYDVTVLNTAGAVTLEDSDGIVLPFSDIALDIGELVMSPTFDPIVAFIGSLPPAGPLDLSLIGLNTPTGTYEVTVAPGSTFDIMVDSIVGAGKLMVDLTIADLDGDFTRIVEQFAEESGSLTANGFISLNARGVVPSVNEVPLPMGAALLPMGLLALASLRRRQKKA